MGAPLEPGVTARRDADTIDGDRHLLRRDAGAVSACRSTSRPVKSVALLGPSGAGKTTTLRLGPRASHACTRAQSCSTVAMSLRATTHEIARRGLGWVPR